MTNYLYRLGHCPDLSVAEFDAITKTTSTNYNQNWLLTDQLINVNKTGSMVYGGEIVFEAEDNAPMPEIMSGLEKYLSINPIKKLGLNIPGVEQKYLLSTAKKHCNKITISGTQPNFGHWKLTNNWIILVHYKTKLYLVKLDSYSDQEFWKNLDSTMPRINMSRGIINLKLGRTLCNLTDNTNIWDNFAGLGRIMIAGADLKDKFWASDIDQKAIEDLNKNWEFSNKYWARSKYDKEVTAKIGILEKAFMHDASNPFPTEESIAIVTEGSLGKNFKVNPTLIEARNESNEIEYIWSDLLENCSKDKNITEIVGCLPFYPRIDFVSQYKKIFENKNWKLSQLTSRHQTIRYQREKSNVGHLVFKLVRA
jgi:hypothetical protein